MKLSLNVKLIGGFIIVAILAAMVGIIGYYAISSTAKDVNILANEAIPVIINLEIMKVRQLEIKASLRSLMTPYGQKEDYERHFVNIERSRKAYAIAIEEYEKNNLTKDEQILLDKYKVKIEISRELNDALINEAKAILNPNADIEKICKSLTERGLSGGDRIAFDEMLGALELLLNYAKNYYAEYSVASKDRGAFNILLIIIFTISAFFIALILGIWIALSISRPVNAIANELTSSSSSLESAAGQVSSSSQELSSGASELASSVEEMTSSIEELQSIIESNSKNINEGEAMMGETMTGSRQAVEEMDRLKIAHEEIKDNSKKIEKIIKVIDDIAFQTNILALNAAVEAARAGEAGRGFAVVADQVKNLAQKSADAAKETAALIETSIEGVDRGYKLGENVSESLGKAVDLAEKVSVLLDEVNKASKEQLKGAVQVTLGITQINTVVQQTASSSEETAAAGEELLSQADMTKMIVAKLKGVVTGRLEHTSSNSHVTTTVTKKPIRQIEHVSHEQFGVNKKNDGYSPEDQIPFDEF